MDKTTKIEIVKAIGVASEMTGGHEFSKNVLLQMVKSLEKFDREDVFKALERCCEEVKGRLTLAHIIERIPDPWPSPDEAWALCPKSEAETVVWFDECSISFNEVSGLMDDKVAARMAFRDIYTRHVQGSRSGGKRGPVWTVSQGHDKTLRDIAIREAVDLGRLTLEEGRFHCPELGAPEGVEEEVPLLPPVDEDLTPEEQRTRAEEMTSHIESLKEKMGTKWMETPDDDNDL